MGLLPTESTPPKSRLEDHIILIHGFPKLGKSTLASQFPKAIFLASEEGQDALDCYRVPIDSWPKLLAICGEIAQGNHNFETLVVDTVDNSWELCRQRLREKRRIEHETDLGYGRGWDMVQSEFHRVLTKLSHLPYGLILISHSTVKEVTTRTGSYHKIVPSLSDRPRKLVLGMASLILYADLEATTGTDGQPLVKRVLRTQPSLLYEAGSRVPFLPPTIDLNFPAFNAAFEAAIEMRKKSEQGKALPE